jgi:hypothetical protein
VVAFLFPWDELYRTGRSGNATRGQRKRFRLTPGKGFHQPQNAPHWVETGDEVSISYTFVFETLSNRRLGRTRGFNHYLRRAGVVPAAPGERPHVDHLKAGTLSAWVPCRKALSRLKTSALRS